MKYPMTNKEFRRALDDLEITQSRAAWLFNGKSPRSGRRWAAEGAPYHVALILTLMKEFELTSEDIEVMGARYRKRMEAA